MYRQLYEKCVIAGQLSPEMNLRIYREKEIFEKAVAGVVPQKHPVAIILGGQNASGKSTLGEQFLPTYRHTGVGIVRIEGDALRDYHPNFELYNKENDKLMVAYTARDSGEWTRRLIEDAGRSYMNMLIETTMRSPEVVCETARRLHNAGYNVQVKIIVVSYDQSLIGCYERYETMKVARGAGRFVHEHALTASYTAMPETLLRLQREGLCSCIHLYTREKTLFQNDYHAADLAGIVKQERMREFRPDEAAFLQERWQIVVRQMSQRNANKEEFMEVLGRLENRQQVMIAEKFPQKNRDTITAIYKKIKHQI
jgi:predicted ABC-type ATPase